MLRIKENKTHHGRTNTFVIPSAKPAAADPFDEDFNPLQASSSDEAESSSSSDDSKPLHIGNSKKTELSVSYKHSAQFLDHASGEERQQARAGSFGSFLFNPSGSSKPVQRTSPPEIEPWSPFDSDSDEDNTTDAQSALTTPTPGRSLLSGILSKPASSEPVLPSSPLSALSASREATSSSPLSSLSMLRDTSSPLSSNSISTLSLTSPTRS